MKMIVFIHRDDDPSNEVVTTLECTAKCESVEIEYKVLSENHQLAESYNITSAPALIVLSDDDTMVHYRKEGLVFCDELKELIKPKEEPTEEEEDETT